MAGPAVRKVLWLIVGFGLALGLRVFVGGSQVADSAVAGLVFAACLVALSWKAWRPSDISWRVLAWGVFGAAVLFIPTLLLQVTSIGEHARPAGSYLTWAATVSVVALAEELFLRGKLYDAVQAWAGRWPAIILGAVLFAILHVPLYGWQVVPLDLAVGLWLGSLRASSRSWAAPGAAHVLADLGAWWIV